MEPLERSYMDQLEYCKFWSRSDGFIHCLDCLFVKECSTYDLLVGLDPIENGSDLFDFTLEYCVDFEISG